MLAQNVSIFYQQDQKPFQRQVFNDTLFYQCFAFERALNEVMHPHTDAGTLAV